MGKELVGLFLDKLVGRKRGVGVGLIEGRGIVGEKVMEGRMVVGEIL